MAREDNVHVSVTVDVDQASKENQQLIASNLENAGQQDFLQQLVEAIADKQLLEKKEKKKEDEFDKILKETIGETEIDAVETIGEQIRTSPKLSNEILDALGIDKKQLLQLVKSPSGAGAMRLGAAAIGGPAGMVLLAALLAEPTLKLIIAELQRPGGFLDKRVKIDATKEGFGLLQRQTRQNMRIGDEQIIIQQFSGFRSDNGYSSTNTSKLIRLNADRVLDIGLFERAEGLR